MSPAPAVITGRGFAVPPTRSQSELWDGFFSDHLGGGKWARRIFESAGAARRHCAVDPLGEDISTWSTGRRMARYLTEALPLGKGAVGAALASAGTDASDIGLLAVVSCTGYATPGIDLHLARDLDLDVAAQRLVIGHMGCYAALPGLGAVSDYVVARGRPAVMLCVELPSLHIQPATEDLEQIVAHALFSDAAAAVVVEPAAPGRGGLSVVDVVALTDAGTADHMTWDVTDLGFRMGLSRRVPDVLARHVGPVVASLLERNGVDAGEVAGWAVHPGGPRILDVVADRLGLDEEAMRPSRHVLAEHGNCSSATVLLVLDALLDGRGLDGGAHVVALAFGPGLTLYAALLRAA
jgi:alkylresorcinol/alkylpyrone synthase